MSLNVQKRISVPRTENVQYLDTHRDLVKADNTVKCCCAASDEFIKALKKFPHPFGNLYASNG